MNESKIEKINMIFWIIFLLIPMFAGWLMYQSLPNEYDERKHELLKSHYIDCGTEGMQSCEVADVWRDDETGKTYNANQFKSHRRSEAIRIAITAFIYGLIGCLFYSYVSVVRHRTSISKSMQRICQEYNQQYFSKETRRMFFDSLRMALIVNFIISIFFFWLI